ncbi:MAG: CBS domain-containing protein [Anaerolineae bacterium]|nr:CBS domain-containing protein [Anaerolineae bacterium]MDW8071850.1 CBS domain-containing protein [Anaerolineae bacterium]
MSDKLVRDVMHRGVITCWADEPLIDVARRLREYSINAIFVLDDSGRAEGVISQVDLARAYVQGNWQHRTAEEVMTPNVVTVTGDLPLRAAIQMMLDKGVRRLLIVQGGRTPNRPVGVLSLSDVVAAMCAEAG